MRFIKSRLQFINESIESKGITNTLSFLSKKCPENAAKYFLKDIRKISDKYDYPMSKLNDMHIKYLPKRVALPLKNENEIENDWGIWCFKFWFSLEEGYLGYTSVNRESFPYKSKRDRTGNTNFNSHELDTLMSSIPTNIETLNPDNTYYKNGGFYPIASHSDYENLRTGDVIAGYFNEDEYEDAFGWAIVYREDTDRVYAIQNKSDGSSPSNPEWRNYGRYSWNIYSGGPSTDHCKLNLFIPGKKNIKSEEVKEEENPLDFNLPLRNATVSKWTGSYDSIDDAEEIEKADFSLVLYFDDMINPDKAEFYERPSDIKTERKRSREGAISLKSDEEIRNENIQRYIEKLVKLLGISPEKTEFKNLNKLVMKCLSGKFSIMSILKKDYRTLDSINEYLYDMLQQTSIDGKKYYFDKITSAYEKTVKANLEYLGLLTQTDNFLINNIDEYDLEEDEKEMFLQQYNKILELGDYIEKTIKNMNIHTIEDLKIISYKLENINNIMNNDRSFNLNERFYNIIRNFNNSNDVDFSMNRIKKSNLVENETRLKNLEKAIKSILS